VKGTDFARLLAALNSGNVRFVVIGGVAVAAHAYVRVTFDVCSHEHLVAMKRVGGRPIDEADLQRLRGPGP